MEKIGGKLSPCLQQQTKFPSLSLYISKVEGEAVRNMKVCGQYYAPHDGL
jgi:hypothetical protein